MEQLLTLLGQTWAPAATKALAVQALKAMASDLGSGDQVMEGGAVSIRSQNPRNVPFHGLLAAPVKRGALQMLHIWNALAKCQRDCQFLISIAEFLHLHIAFLWHGLGGT